VLTNIKNLWNGKRVKQFTDSRNIGLYIFAVVVLAISWSTARAVQSNYQLQKEIAVLEQENNLLALSNENTALQNQFLETDQFLELSARQNLGLAQPGEKVLVVPPTVAERYVDKSLLPASNEEVDNKETPKTGYIQNIESWRDFILGRNLFE
jgi:cell division protein FtsB